MLINSMLRIRIRDPVAFLNLDPGWKNFAPGSGINISDPQHCFGKLRYGSKNSKRIIISFFLSSMTHSTFSTFCFFIFFSSASPRVSLCWSTVPCWE